MKPKFIDANMFLEYTGIDLSGALKDNDNPSAKVESFLGRVELRVMSWVDKNTFRVRDWDRLTNFQLRMFRYALLEQAAYMYRNGDIAQDSGYDQERGVVADKRNLQEITICQPCVDFLIQAGLFNATVKNRRRFMRESVMIGDGMAYGRGPGGSYIPGGDTPTPVPGYYTKEQIDQIVTDLRTYINSQNELDEKKANKTEVLSDASTNSQYPSAKAVFDYANTFGYSVEMSINNDNDLILKLKDKNGTVISTQTVSLPSGAGLSDVSYDNETKELIFTLSNGEEISVYIGSITEDYYTKTESDERYTKKEDILPIIPVSTGEANVLSVINQYSLNNKTILLQIYSAQYLGKFMPYSYKDYQFEFEVIGNKTRYHSSSIIDLTGLTFANIFSSTYQEDYALDTGTLTEQETLTILRGN